MTKRDFETLKKLWDDLKQRCTRVANAYRTIYEVTLSPQYEECYYARSPIDIDCEGVECKGEHIWPGNDYEEYYHNINTELICMSDEELDKWVSEEILRCQKESEVAREMEEKLKRKRKEEQYAKLKKELGYI